MKKIYLLACSAVMCCTSFGQNLLEKIPSDANIVATFNLGRLTQLVPQQDLDSLLAKPLSEAFARDSTVQIKSLKDLGINLQSSAYYFHRDNDSVHYHMMIANLDDMAAMEKLLGPQQIINQAGGIKKYAFEDSSLFLMWNNKQVALAVVSLKDAYFQNEEVAKNHGLSYKKPFVWDEEVVADTAMEEQDVDSTTTVMDTTVVSYSPEEDSVAQVEESYEPDESDFDYYNDRHIKKRISAGCANAALESIFSSMPVLSITANKSFAATISPAAAASVWIDKPIQQYYRSIPNYLSSMYRGFSASGSSEESFGNKSMSAQLNFTDKEAAIDVQMEMTDEMAELQKKVTKRKLNKNFLRYMSSDSLLGYMSWAMDTKAYLQEFPAMLKKTYGQMNLGISGDEMELAAEFFSFLVDEEAIGDLVKGDGVVLFDGVFNHETTYTDYNYDENFAAHPEQKTKMETLPRFLMMMSSEQNKLVQKLISYGIKKETLREEDGFYEIKAPGSPMPFYFAYKNDIFFLTNAHETIKNVVQGSPKTNLSRYDKKMLRENVFNLFVNPAKIAGKLGSTEIGATEPLTKVTNALQEMGPLRMVSYPVKNNVVSSRMWMEIPTGNANALSFFIKMFKSL